MTGSVLDRHGNSGTIGCMTESNSHPMDGVDVVMLGTFSAWRLGTLQARALPLAVALRRDGVRCAIVTVPWDRQDERGVVDCIDGVPLFNTPTASVLQTSRAVAEQMSLARSLHPKLIHVFKPKGFGGLSGRLTRTRPLLIDSDDWEGDGGWNRIGSYNLLQRRVFEWQERHLIRRADAVTAASTLLACRARTLRSRNASATTHHIPNGLTPDWFERLRDTGRRRRSSATVGVPQIVLYSRFAEFASDWLVVFANELDRVASCPVRLCIIGEPPGTEFVNGFRYLLLNFLGYVARHDIPELLASAQIAIFPYDDSLVSRSKNSVKLLELMASGCATVAADVGDVAITLGQAGILVDDRTPIAMARAVADLLRTPHVCEKLSADGQERVRERYVVDSIASQLRRFYDECLVTSP